MIDQLAYYLTFAFVRNALIVGLLTSLSAALLGVVLVPKRLSYLGDGLSHVAFGALAIATALKLTNQTVLVLPITVLMAVVLLSAGQNARIKGDAAIAMLSVSALSVGYLLFNLFPPTGGNISGDVCTTLFGATSILTLTQTQVWQSVGLSALVVLLFVFTYHRLFAVTFDENFARATGTNARAYNVFIAIVIATVVVLAMELVGSLLISALLIFPAISAMGLFKSFRAVVLASAAFGVTCALVGILSSILLGTPVGATIVVADIAGYFLSVLINLVRRRAA
ncbi:MAG: metal ABC transporter permease [Christensenellales bacterium]|jgi:zinc transport system permease protein